MVRSGEMADRSAERTPWTWAALAAALAVSASPSALAQQQAQTDPAQPQAAAQEEERVLLEADELIDDQGAGTITAQGDVQVRFGARTMRADQLIYNLRDGSIRAIGNVQVVLEDGSTTYAEQLEADEELNVAVATELRARLGGEGTLAARAALRHGEGESELRNVIYTSCPICEGGDRPPTWSLRARRAIQDRQSRTISYQGAVLEIAGTPVLFIPYFAHPDPSVERASGFLTPNIGRNRRLGAFYDQPYFWAISPHSDLTASLRIHETVNPLAGLEYRRRFWSGQLNIDATFTNEALFDGEGTRFGADEWRSSVFADGRFDINNFWTWGFGVERITDDDYLRRYDVQGQGQVRGPYIGNDNRLISQLFAIGQDERTYASVTFASIQGLRAVDTPDLLPSVLPFAEAERVFRIGGGQLRVQANLAVLEREDNPLTVGLEGDNARVSLATTWRRDLIVGPGLLVSPFAQVRGDAFRVETSAGEFETFTRGLGFVGTEISWPFMRPGERFDVIVEPVIMAAYATEEEPDARILNDDSLGFEIDDSNLFRPNGAPNYDLWEPGGRVSMGVRATARAVTGESATLMFGRRWRNEVAPGFAPRTNLHDTVSDWVASGQVYLGRPFSAEARLRLDDETLEVQRIDLGVRGAVGRFNATARYFRLEESFAPGNPNEELYAQVGVDLARGWRMQVGFTRDLDSDINLRQDIRAIYEDDCTFLEISYTRRERQTGALGPDEGIQIRIGLRSLGVFGGS